MHQHFQEGLIADAFTSSDLAGLCEIGFRQAVAICTLLFLFSSATSFDPPAVLPFDWASPDFCFT